MHIAQGELNNSNTPSQQNTKHCITFIQRRPSVFDIDPTLYKCLTNVSWDACGDVPWSIIGEERVAGRTRLLPALIDRNEVRFAGPQTERQTLSWFNTGRRLGGWPNIETSLGQCPGYPSVHVVCVYASRSLDYQCKGSNCSLGK